MLLATTLLVGVASAAPHRACDDLVVEVDNAIPTPRGLAEGRSETWLDIDARGRPHVTWSSGWSRVSPMGKWHYELHHASLRGQRWKVEHVPLPPEVEWPDAFGFEYGLWTVIETVDDHQHTWQGPPWLETEDDLSSRVRWLNHTRPRVEGRSRWPEGVHRDPDYDRFAAATLDERSVTVGVAWQPRGRQTTGYHPHGEPYDVYPNENRGRGSLVVWVTEPIAVPSVRLRRRYFPEVALDASGAIHVLLLESLGSDFHDNRYVRLRCRS